MKINYNMGQYISKSALVAEIERRFLEDYNTDDVEMDEVAQGVLASLKYFIDTLEVKEEILDKEGKTKLMQKCVHEAYQRGYDMGVLQTENKINHNIKKVDLEKEYDNEFFKDPIFGKLVNRNAGISIAKHFFELGMQVSNKARKGE